MPLIVASPEMTHGTKSAALVELIDLYPTLVEVARLPASSRLEKRSLGMLLRDPHKRGTEFAVTQHPHPFYNKKPTHIGYAICDDRYQYVEWREISSNTISTHELYDHHIDPRETLNHIDDPECRSTASRLATHAARIVARGGR